MKFCFGSLALALATIAFMSPSWANGTTISLCNNTDRVVLVAAVDSYTTDTMTTRWREQGWYEAEAGRCTRVHVARPFVWTALAFAARIEGGIHPFTYTPNETYNRSGDTPPSFTSVCMKGDGGGMMRRNLSQAQIGQTCAAGADTMVPISMKLYSRHIQDSGILRVVLNEIPGVRPEPSAGGPQALSGHDLWRNFHSACLSDPAFRAMVRPVPVPRLCACYSLALERSIPAEDLAYTYPQPWTADADPQTISAAFEDMDQCNSHSPEPGVTDPIPDSEITERIEALSND